MKKILVMILFVGVLFASVTNTFLQHLRVNGIEDFNIKKGVLTVRQSGSILKGKLLEEAKVNGINKVVYYVNLKDKAGFVIKEYAIKGGKLALGMVFNMKLEAEKYRQYGFNLVKADSIQKAATTMTPQEYQYMRIFKNICIKTRAVFCKNEKPAMVILKAYLNNR